MEEIARDLRLRELSKQRHQTVLNMEIQIRSASSDELPQLIALQTESLKVLCAQDYDPEQILALVEDQGIGRERLDELLFVAEVGAEIVGFTSLLRRDRTIGAMFVHPDWSRKGVGSKLLAAVETAAVEQQTRVLWVMASLTGVPFYQAQGYQARYSTGFWAGRVWIPCQILEKRLLPPESLIEWLSRNRMGLGWLLLLSAITLGMAWCQVESQRARTAPASQGYGSDRVPFH